MTPKETNDLRVENALLRGALADVLRWMKRNPESSETFERLEKRVEQLLEETKPKSL